jgi:hypothetical protein
MYRHTNDYPAASHRSLSAVTEWGVLMSVAMVLKKTCKTREDGCDFRTSVVDGG